MAFSFTLSASSATLNPNGTVSVTLTQQSSDPQEVHYNVNSIYAGGWDSPSFLDQYGNVTYAFSSTPARIPGNGSLTLTFFAKSGVIAQTLAVTVTALQQMTSDASRSTINQAQAVTLTIT